MGFDLVRRSLCEAAYSFQTASKPFKNAELINTLLYKLYVEVYLSFLHLSLCFVCFYVHSVFILVLWRVKTVKTFARGKQQHCLDLRPFWIFRVLKNYVSDSHVIISQTGPMELINLEAGEMGQFLHCKTFTQTFPCSGTLICSLHPV